METTTEKILNMFSYKGACWGHICNELQDIAFDVLPNKSLKKYSKQSSADLESCEGSDYLLINGQYFDWKEFSYRSKDIVRAFLGYFTETDLKTIYKELVA